MTKPSARSKTLLILGGIGVAIHLLFLRWSIFRPSSDVSGTINNFFVSATLGLLGGLFYALFLKYPVNESIRDRKTSLLALLKGGMLGAAATALAFQGRYLVAACFLTYKEKLGVPDVNLGTAFSLAVLSIETYAVVELFYLLIPAFVCGVLVAGVVARSSFRASGEDVKQ